MKQCSLITVVNNQNAQLANLLKGLLMSTHTPAEIIVVDIGNTVELPPVTPVGVITVGLNNSTEKINLAAARNEGVKIAHHEHLIFLDVDCIPSSAFIENMLDIIQHTNGLVMGQPRLLSQSVQDNFTQEDLTEMSIEDPESSSVKIALKKEEDYNLFQSLGFGLSRMRFEQIEGFSTDYENVKISDRDFAKKANKAGIPFYTSNTIVYHQSPHISLPPVHLLDSIIKDSNYFNSKWNSWPTEQWLKQFNDLGFIEWDQESKTPIKILKTPEAAELKQPAV